MAKIRKGDLVEVISGAREARGGDRGKQGRVIAVLPEQDRVVVEGVNFVTKHVRVGQTQRGTKTGGIETHEAPIHISNVALVDPDTKKPARVGFTVETDANGRTVRTRYFKKSRRVAEKKAAKSGAKASAAKAKKDAESTESTEDAE